MVANPRTDEVGVGASEKAATSPYPGEIGSEPAPEVATTTDVGEEEEEEEDENRDMHFKLKRMMPSPVVFPVASPRKKTKQTIRPSGRYRGTLQIWEAKTPVVDVHPRCSGDYSSDSISGRSYSYPSCWYVFNAICASHRSN